MVIHQLTQIMRQNCKKCGYSTESIIDVCPQCQTPFRTDTSMRRNGYLQIGLGAFLVVLIGGVAAVLGKIMLFPTPGGAHFTGNGQDIAMIAGIFGLVLSIGFAVMFNGYWQIAYGRRNKYVIYFILGFAVAFYVIGRLAKSKLI